MTLSKSNKEQIFPTTDMSDRETKCFNALARLRGKLTQSKLIIYTRPTMFYIKIHRAATTQQLRLLHVRRSAQLTDANQFPFGIQIV